MKQSFTLFLSFTIACLCITSCKQNKSNYLKAESENENKNKAALYDESLSKTYVFLTDIHQSLYVIINTYEMASLETKNDNSSNFKESFENHFYDLLKSNSSAKDAWATIVSDESFRSTAVCGFLSNDGGLERQEQALAFRKFVAIWFELSSPSRLEYDSYDSLIERLNLLRKTLSESMPMILEHIKSYDKDKYSWREYTPYK